MGLLGLFGCGRSGPRRSDSEWNQLLVEELQPLPHVAELSKFGYSMQGVLGRKNSAWISGIVRSDTDDERTNRELLEEVGRRIVTVHRDNPVKESWVKVYVSSPSRVAYEFKDLVGHTWVTLEDLAERYGIDR